MCWSDSRNIAPTNPAHAPAMGASTASPTRPPSFSPVPVPDLRPIGIAARPSARRGRDGRTGGGRSMHQDPSNSRGNTAQHDIGNDCQYDGDEDRRPEMERGLNEDLVDDVESEREKE